MVGQLLMSNRDIEEKDAVVERVVKRVQYEFKEEERDEGVRIRERDRDRDRLRFGGLF